MNTNNDEPNEISNNKEDTEPQNSNHEDDNSEKNETTVDESKHTDNENKLQPFPEMIKFSSLTKLIEKKDNKPTI